LAGHQFLSEFDDPEQLLGTVGVVEIDAQLFAIGESARKDFIIGGPAKLSRRRGGSRR
jgi:hypothetical protein